MYYFIRGDLYCFKQGSFLSNFYEHPFEYKGRMWMTSEHAYQAMKSEDIAVQSWIWKSGTPAMAKRRGRQIAIRKDWDLIKIDVMEDILHYKFKDALIRFKLLKTAPYKLVEYTWWGDRFWGVDENFVGENHLGKLLTEIRDDYITDVISP